MTKMNSGWRVLDCTEMQGTLQYQRGRLVVNAASQDEECSLPLSQIAILLVGFRATLSGALLSKLSEYDIAVLVCDWRKVPVSAVYPWNDHSRICARNRAQASLSKPKLKQAWARIVRAKILGQSNTLFALGLARDNLRNLVNSVRSGDPDNVEAQAAKLFWQQFSNDQEFRRRPGFGSDCLNSALDYGYTILRGHGIRAVTAAGLNPALGVFHHSRGNAFALVDDLMEPFRPAVDWIVARSFDESEQELTQNLKRSLVEGISNQPFGVDGKTIPTVFTAFAQEFGRYVEGDLPALCPPVWEPPDHD